MDLPKDANVWEVKRSAGSTYTWTLLTDAGNTINPVTGSHNGSYGKFQLINVSGNEYLIGKLRLATDIFAFRLHNKDRNSALFSKKS